MTDETQPAVDQPVPPPSDADINGAIEKLAGAIKADIELGGGQVNVLGIVIGQKVQEISARVLWAQLDQRGLVPEGEFRAQLLEELLKEVAAIRRSSGSIQIAVGGAVNGRKRS